MFTQLLHVERVRQAAHVKHKVGFERQTVFKAEADAMHRNGVVVVLQKQVGNARFQSRRRNVRRIDDVIGDLFEPGAASRAPDARPVPKSPASLRKAGGLRRVS